MSARAPLKQTNCPRLSSSGFTLLETLVAYALTAVLLYFASQMISASSKATTQSERASSSLAHLLTPLSLLKKDIKQAVDITEEPGKLTLKSGFFDSVTNGVAVKTVIYTWSQDPCPEFGAGKTCTTLSRQDGPNAGDPRIEFKGIADMLWCFYTSSTPTDSAFSTCSNLPFALLPAPPPFQKRFAITLKRFGANDESSLLSINAVIDVENASILGGNKDLILLKKK